MRTGIWLGLLVLLAGIMFLGGLKTDTPFLIGIAFVVFAFCAIFGVNPNWPSRRADSQDDSHYG